MTTYVQHKWANAIHIVRDKRENGTYITQCGKWYVASMALMPDLRGEREEDVVCYECRRIAARRFHSTAEWRRIKQTPEDWQEAITVDEAIRKVRPPYDLYLHPSRIPLVDVDLRSEADRGQLSLWDAECDGVCGV